MLYSDFTFQVASVAPCFAFHPKRKQDRLITEVLVFKRLNDRLEWLGNLQVDLYVDFAGGGGVWCWQQWWCDDDDDDDDLFHVYSRYSMLMTMWVMKMMMLQHTPLWGRHTFWVAATFAFCYGDISLMYEATGWVLPAKASTSLALMQMGQRYVLGSSLSHSR